MNVIANGKWGDCQWTISEEGVLTIHEGKADSIPSNGEAAWYEFRDKIERVIVDGPVSFDEGASLGYMFKDCSNAREFDLENLNTAGVVSMHSLFEGCSSLEEVDLAVLDTSHVTSFNGMFNSCSSLKRVNLDGIQTSHLLSMIGTFMNCVSLEEIDLSPLDTSNVVDMSWLFCRCEKLRRVDLSMLDTSRVMDMSCMFLSCYGLEEVILGDIDTSSVMDTSRMFMYCRNLKTLDLWGIDNSAVDRGDGMFLGCEKLRAVVPGERFHMSGSGKASIELPESRRDEDTDMVSDWRTSTDGIFYVPDTEFILRYDGNGAGGGTGSSEITCTAGDEVTIRVPEFTAPEGKVFREWNTRKAGHGQVFSPGDVMPVHADMTLYAIWAGEPIIKETYDIEPLTYGQTISLTAPEVDPNNGAITSVQAQIRRRNEKGWTDIDGDEILPVKDSGAMVRYQVTNFVGTSYSEARPVRINKAVYDMSQVHWVLPENPFYDGAEKTVVLEGLPEGVHAEYTGNKANLAGNYTATAILSGDEENYEPLDPVDPLPWTIQKGKYDMESLDWSYLGAFVYDGEEKSVRLDGLPQGTVAYYDGADAVNAGTYTATAGLDYDIDNFDRPEGIQPCRWEILKSTHDMSDVHWEGPEEFTYDGAPKKVELSALPEGVTAEYTGNTATDAGKYTARAAFTVDDPVNFEIPDPVSFDWEIRKADHDMTEAKWTCEDPIYDGTLKEIHLEGLPEGVSAVYEGNTGTNAGDYSVRAELIVEDLNNYNPLGFLNHPWKIRKATFDVSRVRWNYSSPYVYNGREKRIELRNLPEDVMVTYEGNRGVVAGQYEAKAYFYYDEQNFEEPDVPPCKWEILKGHLPLHEAGWDMTEPFVYDGNVHEVKMVGLPEYATVRYEGNKGIEAGTYKATAYVVPNDKDNYYTPDPMEFTWDIRKAVYDIGGAEWTTRESRVFDGTNKAIALTDIPSGVNVTYSGNMAEEAGVYRARATFDVKDKKNFVAPDPMEVEWAVEPRRLDLSGVYWDYQEPFVYDGSEKHIALAGVPEGVTVRYEGELASEAGEYKATAILIPEDGNYRETDVLGQIWKIEKADIDVTDAYWDDPRDFVYDGGYKSVEILGLPDGLEVSYEGNLEQEAGSYYASATLTPVDSRNFKAPRIDGHSWSIEPAQIDMSGARWSGFETFSYDGRTHRVLLENAPDTVVVSYEGNAAENAGHYVATANFKPLDEDNYKTPAPLQYAWEIGRADIDVSGITWETGDDFVYDGQEHEVRLMDVPETLNVTYQGNRGVDAGEYIASAVLTPVDDTNFNTPVIEPHRWSIGKLEIDASQVRWVAAEKLIYDGKIKVVGLTGLPPDVEIEYENNSAIDAGTYHASAVISADSSNYDAPDIRGCTWTIAKAVPDVSDVEWNYVIDFTYDGYEKTVELMDVPAGMKAVYEGNAAIEAGTYTATAKLVMDDPANYDAPEVEPLEWKILKREYDMSTASWVPAEGFVYSGMPQEITLTGLEDGLEPIYEGNRAVEAGRYHASATFLYDEDNYHPPQSLETDWEIHKAPYNVNGVRWDYAGPFAGGGKGRTVSLMTVDGEQQTGRLFGRKKDLNYVGLPEGTTVRYEGNSARTPGVYTAKAYLTIPDMPNYRSPEPIVLQWEILDE